MVHNYHSRVTTLSSGFFLLLILLMMLSPTTGCGGGGGGELSSQVKGILTDSFGSVINMPEAVISLDQTNVTGHPDANGAFSLEAAPGNYTLRGIYTNVAAGIKIQGTKAVTLTQGQTLDAGNFQIGNQSLVTGWDKYRSHQYADAKNAFTNYLNAVRSGQSVGSDSAYSALGWVEGNGLNDNASAIANFQTATSAWAGNTDAWVGLAASKLALMRSDGHFYFSDALQAIKKAIDNPGDYHSSPVHDHVSESDLRAYRSFISFLNGDSVDARAEATQVQQEVLTSGNGASQDVIDIVLEFTK